MGYLSSRFFFQAPSTDQRRSSPLLSSVMKSAKENIKLIDPEVVSRHPSILVILLNIAVSKMLAEDTSYYPSNLMQEHKPRILWNFHVQSGKILLLLSYFLAFKIIYQEKNIL